MGQYSDFYFCCVSVEIPVFKKGDLEDVRVKVAIRSVWTRKPDSTNVPSSQVTFSVNLVAFSVKMGVYTAKNLAQTFAS